jgi:hypothetical protein
VQVVQTAEISLSDNHLNLLVSVTGPSTIHVSAGSQLTPNCNLPRPRMDLLPFSTSLMEKRRVHESPLAGC